MVNYLDPYKQKKNKGRNTFDAAFTLNGIKLAVTEGSRAAVSWAFMNRWSDIGDGSVTNCRNAKRGQMVSEHKNPSNPT